MKKEVQQSIVIGDTTVHVTKKKVKNLNLSVHAPDGKVKLSAPHHMKNEEIQAFITSKIPWISKQQEKVKKRQTMTTNKLPEYLTTERHCFAGKKYYFKILDVDCFEGKPRVEISVVGEMVMYVNPRRDREYREKLMKAFYREHLKKEIPSLIAKWEPIMKVKVNDWGVKQMKTRWGSCNVQTGRIWLNLELAKKSPDCLEYLVVHEMVHLLERKHSERFYQLMDKFLPTWRERKKELNGHSL